MKCKHGIKTHKNGSVVIGCKKCAVELGKLAADFGINPFCTAAPVDHHAYFELEEVWGGSEKLPVELL